MEEPHSTPALTQNAATSDAHACAQLRAVALWNTRQGEDQQALSRRHQSRICQGLKHQGFHDCMAIVRKAQALQGHDSLGQDYIICFILRI